MKRILAAATLALMVGASPLVSAYAATAELKPYSMDAKVDMRASALLGQRIYATADDVEGRTLSQAELAEFEDIGEINDMVVSADGQIKAVVLGIGGFLGLGERDLTVEMSSLRFVSETDGTGTFIVVNADKASLTAMADEQKMAEAPVTEAAEATGDAVAETVTVATDATQAAGETVVEKVEEGAAAVEQAATDTETVVAESTTVVAEGATVTTTEPANTAAVEREVLVKPQVETEGYADVAIADLTADDFTGKRVYGVDGEDVGEIADLVMSDDGQISQAVLDVGGFLGIGERKIAVPMDELQLTRNDEGELRVYIQATQAQLEAQPEYVAQ